MLSLPEWVISLLAGFTPNDHNVDMPAEVAIDIMGERAKRKAILELLYDRLIKTPGTPALTTLEMEATLGLEKNSMLTAAWYMKERLLVKSADSGRLTITARGIDRYEELTLNSNAIRD